MNTFFAILNVGILFIVAWRISAADGSGVKRFFWPALVFKLLAGICLGLLYRYYYNGGDTFAYFEESTKLSALARSDLLLYLRFLRSGDESFTAWNSLTLLQPRALFMIKIVSVANLFSHDNYWINSLYFSFVSFLSAWMLVKAITRFSDPIRHVTVAGFLFFPSVVFWSSGLMKESLAIAALFFLAAVFLKAWMREPLSLWTWVLTLISLWLLWRLKYYYLAVFLPIAFASLIVRLLFLGRWNDAPKFYHPVVWCGVFLIPLVVIALLRPNFHPDRFLHVVVSNYRDFQMLSAQDDLIHYQALEPTVASVLTNAPWALFSGLFRPLPWEAGTALKFFMSVENILLLILSVAALSNIPKVLRSPNRLLLFSVALYVVILCVFLALSTPNFGTLARYRVGFLPFFFLLIAIENPVLIRLERVIQRSRNHLVR